MEVKGRIIVILPENSGEGKNGLWRSRDAVLETEGQYPKKVVFNLFGDAIDKFPFVVGDMVAVSFDIDSREYNGKWYPSIKAWKVDVSGVTSTSVAPSVAPSVIPAGLPISPMDLGGDLPF